MINMKHLKLFESFDIKGVENFEIQVAKRVLELMEEQIGPLSTMVTGDDKVKYVLEMIDGHENIHGEWVANFPEHIQLTVGELFEYGVSVEDAALKYVDDCISLYNGHGSAL